MTDHQRGYRDTCTHIAEQFRSAAAGLREYAAKNHELEGYYISAAIDLEAHAKAVEKLGENAPEEK